MIPHGRTKFNQLDDDNDNDDNGMKFAVDFTMVLVFNPKAYVKEQDASFESWDPSPNTPERCANLACLWLDPFWTGLVCKRLGDPIFLLHNKFPKENGTSLPSSSPSLNPPLTCQEDSYNKKNKASYCCAMIFKVQGQITPCQASLVQAIANDWPAPHEPHSLCDSIKIHFFHTEHDGYNMRRDFLYSSAFPFKELFRNGNTNPAAPGAMKEFGLFNYNYADTSANAIPGFRLMLWHHGPPVSLPHNVILYPIAGIPADEHERVLRVGNWIADAINRLCPDVKTSFSNMRTFSRDRQNTLFFQDLHILFDTEGTCLPPTLAIYALCGALFLNGGISPEVFSTYMIPNAILPAYKIPNPILRPLFLRIVRDVIACFTICCVEGIYWADTSLRTPTEDQPFPLNFVPAERVFSKDDCEGRVCQVQQMVILLRWMHLCVKRIGIKAFVQKVQSMRSFEVLMGTLPNDYVYHLIVSCCTLGNLFENGILDVETTVGDVHFGSLEKSNQENTVGHSFAVCFIHTHNNNEHAASVIEATGWERQYIPSYDPPSLPTCNTNSDKKLIDYVEHLLQKMKENEPYCGKMRGIICTVTSIEKESLIYKRLCLGKGSIYFTYPPIKTKKKSDFSKKENPLKQKDENDEGEEEDDDITTNTTPNTTTIQKTYDIIQPKTLPQYGVNLSLVYSAFRSGAQELCQCSDKKQALALSTRDFVAALNGQGPAAGLWPCISGANHILLDLDKIHATFPERRRCFRPPQKSERNIEHLMCHTWGPIRNEDLSAWSPNHKPAQLYFSIPSIMNSVTADCGSALQHTIQCELTSWAKSTGYSGVKIRSFPFMASLVFGVWTTTTTSDST